MKKTILLITIILFVTLNSIFAGWQYSSNGSFEHTWISNDSERIIDENSNSEPTTYSLQTIITAEMQIIFIIENTEKILDAPLTTNTSPNFSCYSREGDNLFCNLNSSIINENSIALSFVPGDSTINEQKWSFVKMLLEGDVTFCFNYKSDSFYFDIDNSNFESKISKLVDMLNNQE